MKNILLLVSIYLLPSFAFGHAFWMEPSSYSAIKDQMLSFTLFVGEEFTGDQIVRHPSHLKEFQMFTAASSEPAMPIFGRVGRSPAGYAKIPENKNYVVSYVSEFSEATITPEKFAYYLETEQMKNLVSTPDRNGDHEIKELFARFTKALVSSETQLNEPVDRQIGTEIELYHSGKSLLIEKAKPLTMLWQLFFRKKALENRSVFLESKATKKIVASGKTDKDGLISFTIDTPGVYMVRTINLLPADKVGWDWQSYWTSTSFELRVSSTK